MIRINLLPHREEKRKQNLTAFYVLLSLAGILGIVCLGMIAAYIQAQISVQTQRNDYIKKENTMLDGQIKEIASLKQEIDGLKARQQAVEDLQSDRNQPVYLMDELVKQTPEGIYLKSFEQKGQRVEIKGFAQSNERVSEILRNMGNNSLWLERPDLIEISAKPLDAKKDAKKVFNFTVNVGIKRLRDKEKDKEEERNKGKDKDQTLDQKGKPSASASAPNSTVAASASAAASGVASSTASATVVAGKASASAAASTPVVAAPKKP